MCENMDQNSPNSAQPQHNRSTLHPPPPRNCRELANPGHSKQICETNVENLADPWRWRKTWVFRPREFGEGESLWWKKKHRIILDSIESICCNPFNCCVEGYDTRILKHSTYPTFPFLVYNMYICSLFCFCEVYGPDHENRQFQLKITKELVVLYQQPALDLVIKFNHSFWPKC